MIEITMTNSTSEKPVFNRYERIMIGLGLSLLVFFLGYGLGQSTAKLDEGNFVYAEIVDGDAKLVGKKIFGRDVLPEIATGLADLEREKYRLKRAATEKKLAELLRSESDLEKDVSTTAEGAASRQARLADFARERGIDLGKLSEQQRRDLEGNYRILVKQLAVRDQTKKAMAEGKVEWGILPLYHRDPVEVAAGVMAPIVSGTGDHRVVVFANYHCPVCGSLWAKLDELAAKSNGKTSVHLRYFVQEGDAWIVKQTAMAGYCLDEQKKLSEFHRSMRERAPVDEADLLKRVSEIPGFAQARFENCWKARLTEQKLERDFKDGQALGLSGQALAVVNGIPMQAQEPLSEYLILIRQ